MKLSRRRFLSISAAAAALPCHAHAAGTARWRGTALGAQASMILIGIDEARSARVFREVESELRRLEQIFSLYRTDSSLVRLNEHGQLPSPPAELLEVLALCDAVYSATDGAFDPTVQPLWHALANGMDPGASRQKVGWEKVIYDTNSVRFMQDGMGITLNGIAQGYVTDRISGLLISHGLGNILIDIGEIAAHGKSDKDQPWRAGIAEPGGKIVHRVTLADRALATSAPFGTVLGGAGVPHILGAQGQETRHQLVSVSAPYAAVADALSTGICLLCGASAQAAVARFPEARIEYLA